VRLHRVEGLLVDEARHLNRDHLIVRLVGAVLGAPVELVDTDVGGAGQHPVNGANTPAPAHAGVEPALVQMLGDRLHAHAPPRAVALQRQAEGEPHRVGVKRVDLQLLLELGPALLRVHHPIADRRQRAVPEALPRILLQGAKRVLGVLLGLVLVEQRHDLAHHHVHGIVAKLLRHGDELDAVPGELPDVELQLEVVAEEAAERMNDHHVEAGRLLGPGLHHALELRPPIIGRRGARLDIGLHQLVVARGPIRLALLALVGDGHVMFGLPRGRDAQVEGGAERDRAHAAFLKARCTAFGSRSITRR
jgi:hypothetical protein